MKLTRDNLINLGFRGQGKDTTGEPAYRLEIPKNEKFGYYPFELQLVLGDYPSTNPNSGVLSIFSKAEKDLHMFTDTTMSKKNQPDFILGKVEGEIMGEETVDYEYGIKYISFPETVVHIAWYVNTLERLNSIYTALTGNPPLKLRETKRQNKSSKIKNKKQ